MGQAIVEREAESRTIEIVRKLLAKAESLRATGGDIEADVFAGHAQKMILEHKLEMSSVEEMRATDGDVDMGRYSPHEHGYTRKRRRIAWEEDLANAVAYGYFCHQLIADRSNTRWFVGRKTDREMAIWLFAVLVRRFEDESWKAYYRETGEWHGFRASWLNGAVRAISEKMRAQRGAFARTSEMTSAIVKSTEADIVEWKKNRGVEPAPPTSVRQTSNLNAYYKGYDYGEKTQVSTPLEQSSAGGNRRVLR